MGGRLFYAMELHRARRYADILERLIAPDGTFPSMGRSTTYRFGAFHALAQVSLMRELPAIASGKLRLHGKCLSLRNGPVAFGLVPFRCLLERAGHALDFPAYLVRRSPFCGPCSRQAISHA
jgi:hypothetical protein